MSFFSGFVGIPYWRLSSFYFFYFALVGALSPFFSLYLADIGLAAYAIGLVNAVLMGTKIIAPNIWGWLCDRTGQRLRIITIGSALSTVFFTGLFFSQSLISLLIIVFCYSFFWNAILAQFDTHTIQCLQSKSDRYGHIRLWGSVGFIVAVAILGVFFDAFSIRYLIPISWVLLLCIFISCVSLRGAPTKKVSPSPVSWRVLFRRPAVIAFFVSAFLLQLSFGAYYTFFSLYLESYHYSRTTIGLLWALGVVAEVILFLYIHRIMPKMGVAYLLCVSLLLTGIRWWVIAFFADTLWVIIVSQAIHAFSFGAAHAASIELIRQFFKGSHAGQGNALYSSLTYGIGGAIGALGSGLLWEIDPQLLFIVSGVAVFLATAVAGIFLCGKKLD
jgi:PPP family 3-phenylpropionic acid transporter